MTWRLFLFTFLCFWNSILPFPAFQFLPTSIPLQSDFFLPHLQTRHFLKIAVINKNTVIGVPAVVQWVKDLTLQLQLKFDLWPELPYDEGVAEKGRKNKRKRKEKKKPTLIISSHTFILYSNCSLQPFTLPTAYVSRDSLFSRIPQIYWLSYLLCFFSLNFERMLRV